ncbi:response regulator [Rhodopirellula sallentina]|uniref:Translational regulator CsrA n=1 Tax=Rhodopirellula sallentina SM41 TaxID=1263870 RepID=M5UAX3_9BACT|nr:response regulator [Rhodopirellula sallentina]EMI53143.1 response regulator receiver protein [Rhodopirellula sallentina SM41]
MLVLSRKPDESIFFPGLGITISILRTDQRTARVGIDAPPQVRILRKELLDGTDEETFDVASFEQTWGGSSKNLHELRNQLNTLNLGLQFYRQQMDAGLVDEANVTFLRVVNQLDKIEHDVSKHAEAEAVREAQACEEPLRPIQVLLVEDDADQRELLAGVLAMRGCEVATACDGNDALNYLGSHPWPDFVLLDMRMPNGDGASTVRALRKINASPHLRIVATSGTSPQDLGISQGSDGVDHWFPKPLNTDGLIRYMQQPTETNLSTSS